MIFVLLYDGNSRRLNRKWFYVEPGIEPATPGLQGIALIHYTTGRLHICIGGQNNPYNKYP